MQALADFFAEPPRGHCGDGFLHRADAYFRSLVLLFRDQPRSQENSALQRDEESKCTLDRSADA